jgi:limonene-1,2-epoxide hydrolase
VVDLTKMAKSYAFAEEINVSLVKDFFDEWANGNFVASAKKSLAQDVVWKSPWGPDCVGKADCLARLEQLSSRIAKVKVEWLSFLSETDPISKVDLTVLGERRDVYEAVDGTEYAAECSVAVRVHRGEIVYWRDYLDPRPFISDDGTWPLRR